MGINVSVKDFNRSQNDILVVDDGNSVVGPEDQAFALKPFENKKAGDSVSYDDAYYQKLIQGSSTSTRQTQSTNWVNEIEEMYDVTINMNQPKGPFPSPRIDIHKRDTSSSWFNDKGIWPTPRLVSDIVSSWLGVPNKMSPEIILSPSVPTRLKSFGWKQEGTRFVNPRGNDFDVLGGPASGGYNEKVVVTSYKENGIKFAGLEEDGETFTFVVDLTTGRSVAE